MECAICFEDTKNRIQPCKHAFCERCILRWMDKKVTCPLCKQVLASPRLDVTSPHPSLRLQGWTGGQEHIGVTLRNDTNGVVIHNINEKDKAFISGLRKGHVITHVNNIPVTCHESAIQIMTSAQDAKLPVNFTLHVSSLSPKPSKWNCWAVWRKIRNCFHL